MIVVNAMGWETTLTTKITFFKETYGCLQDVETAIEEEEELLKQSENELLSLCLMTEPQKMLQIDEGIHYYDEIRQRYDDCLEIIKDCTIKLFKLRRLRSEWDKCHVMINGKEYAKNEPDEFNPPYLWGDYLRNND